MQPFMAFVVRERYKINYGKYMTEEEEEEVVGMNARQSLILRPDSKIAIWSSIFKGSTTLYTDNGRLIANNTQLLIKVDSENLIQSLMSGSLRL